MKIVFHSDEKSHGTLVFDTDWTFAKKILDMIWKEITIEAFDRKIKKNDEKGN